MQIPGPSHVHGPHPTGGPHRPPSPQQPSRPASASPTDELDISPQADLVSRVREIDGVRTERVERIRAEIAAGVYETAQKLDVAVDRLLDEIG